MRQLILAITFITAGLTAQAEIVNDEIKGPVHLYKQVYKITPVDIELCRAKWQADSDYGYCRIDFDQRQYSDLELRSHETFWSQGLYEFGEATLYQSRRSIGFNYEPYDPSNGIKFDDAKEALKLELAKVPNGILTQYFYSHEGLTKQDPHIIEHKDLGRAVLVEEPYLEGYDLELCKKTWKIESKTIASCNLRENQSLKQASLYTHHSEQVNQNKGDAFVKVRITLDTNGDLRLGISLLDKKDFETYRDDIIHTIKVINSRDQVKKVARFIVPQSNAPYGEKLSFRSVSVKFKHSECADNWELAPNFQRGFCKTSQIPVSEKDVYITWRTQDKVYLDGRMKDGVLYNGRSVFHYTNGGNISFRKPPIHFLSISIDKPMNNFNYDMAKPYVEDLMSLYSPDYIFSTGFYVTD